MSRLAVLVLFLVSAVTAAAAQEGRYRFETTEDGYVRFDSGTGDISVCRKTGEELVCRMSADERRALEDQIDTLQARVEELEAALAGVEAAPEDGLPSEAELDRTLGIMEEVFRRFHGMVRDLESDPPADGDR